MGVHPSENPDFPLAWRAALPAFWASFDEGRDLKTTLRCAVLAALLMPAIAATAQPYPRLSRAELMAKYGDPAGKIMTIGGVEVYYKDEGRGPAILMVHGSVSTLKTYDGVAAALKGRYRVIRYDVPPGGLSGPVSDAAAASLRPADIAATLLDRLGVKSATVVGVSSGGTLGLYLAAARPDLVKRLILSNTPSDPVDASHLKQPDEFVAAQKEAARAHFQSQAFWDQFLSYFSGDPARITPAIRQQYYDFNRRLPEAHPIDLVAQVADHARAVAAMNAVTAPTLLIWGARDPLLTPPTAATLAGYLTHARVSEVFMPDVGHYPPLEAPARFARIVADYMEAVTPDP
jgi:pimeloyl-ACP methyl ester carboxylesterase